jgi:hypothetical protein
MSRVNSKAFNRRLTVAFERFERPKGAPDKASGDHPGRLQVGPEEK